MADTTSAALRSSRPTILLSGQESASLAQGLLAMRIEESVTGIASCELARRQLGSGRRRRRTSCTSTAGTSTSARRSPSRIGGHARSSAAASPGSRAQFPEGSPPTLLLLAEDRLQDLRMTRRTRTFDEPDRRGHDPSRSPAITASTPTCSSTARPTGCSRSSTRATSPSCGSAAGRSTPRSWVEDRSLKVRRRTDRAGGGSDALELGYGHELREFTVTADLAGQASEVTVGGWDVAGKAAIKETATASVVESELKGGDSGASILGRALATRKASAAHTAPITATRGAGPRRGPLPASGSTVRARSRPRRDQRAAARRADRQADRPRAPVQRRVLRHRDPASCSTRCSACGPSSPPSARGWDGHEHLRPHRARRAPRGGGSAQPAAAGSACSRRRSPTSTTPTGRAGSGSSLPWAPDGGGARYEAWARMATLMAGNEPRDVVHPRRRRRGADRVPGAAIRAGRTSSAGCGTARTRRPSRWTGPATNELKVIRSRNGVKVTLDDTRRARAAGRGDAGRPEGRAQGRAGHHRDHRQQRQLDQARVVRGHGHRGGQGDGQRPRRRRSRRPRSRSTRAMSTFSGVVKADTVITNSVISTSYTPGAGNIW